jgi:hypothetical protein
MVAKHEFIPGQIIEFNKNEFVIAGSRWIFIYRVFAA